jgi:putative membrane-bound dehydrogenase-like protein
VPVTRLVLALVLFTLAAPAADGPPYAPPQALATFRLEPGFRIELMASEPDVTSPVAMDIDERGRWFVVEMPGYPVDTRPIGRVRLLEDTNHDGRPDRSTVFADGLVLPTGVMRWKRGVLVTAAPDLLYFEDADDDGRAETREAVLTGFAVTNPQHSVNHPVYGLDNWIHLAYSGGFGALIFPELFGDRGKPLTFPAAPQVAPVDPKARPVRVRLSPPSIEPRSGRTQFGGTFDAYGRYFTSSNNDHIRHEVVAARYLERNPLLPVAAAMHVISDHGGAARVFPVTANPRYELLTESGEFTSACALTVYTGGLFGGEYARSTFVAEPVHNLVHRDVLEPSGATFVARRGGDGREFLASTDAWFRPVNFYIGPDGALYVIDYYRPRIEHPEWTASEFHAKPAEFWEGRDRGRIYRVVPEHAGRPAPVDLSRAGDEALVEALGHPNLWQRRTAQRLLVGRRSPRAGSLLDALVREAASPVARVHALWTLDGLGVLSDAQVLRALGDGEPGVRENALQLAEPRLGNPLVAAAILARAVSESDARVQFQLLSTLGALDTPESRAAQQRLFFSRVDDRWMQVAALSAGPDRPSAYLEAALSPGSVARAQASEGRRAFFTLAASAVAATRDGSAIGSLIARVGAGAAAAGWWQAATLDGIRQGLRGGGGSVLADSREALVTMAQSEGAEVRRASLALLQLAGRGESPTVTAAVASAVVAASSKTLDAERRADAVTLAALGGVGGREATFQALVVPHEPEAVQVAAIEALASSPGEQVGRWVLEIWPTLTPRVRSAAVDLLLGNPPRQALLVEALERGRVQSWTMNFWQKRALIMHRDPQLRAAARALLEERPEARAAIVNQYAAAVERGGDSARGEAVFARACAACHKIGGGASSDLGPDLSGIRHRPPLALLVDVLSPNQAIAQGYETYVVQRTNGLTEAGTLAEQSPVAVTLRQAGQPIVIPRAEIRQITMLPQSSMPSDLDRVISPGEMADLLAYVTKR